MFGAFYGLQPGPFNLSAAIKTYEGRVPDAAFPFADSPGGNLLCLYGRGSDVGRVVFWNHELELGPTPAVTAVADSFQEFIAMLAAEPEVTVDLVDVRIDWNPRFLERAKQWKAAQGKKRGRS